MLFWVCLMLGRPQTNICTPGSNFPLGKQATQTYLPAGLSLCRPSSLYEAVWIYIGEIASADSSSSQRAFRHWETDGFEYITNNSLDWHSTVPYNTLESGPLEWGPGKSHMVFLVLRTPLGSGPQEWPSNCHSDTIGGWLNIGKVLWRHCS